MKVLYSHFGREGKDGWGRSFYMAKAMANLGHEVVFLTNIEKFSFFRIAKKNIHNVKVIAFPDIIPSKLKSSGFGLLSIIGKILYSASHKFDLVIADCGHRSTGLPCKINRFLYKSTYFSEWWDYFGAGGYYDNKPLLFKILYGWIEKKAEINDKLNADGVIVLSELMKNRALQNGVKNVIIVHGGCLINEIKASRFNTKNDNKINFCYIGMAESEIIELDPFLKALSNPDFKNEIRFITFGSYLRPQIIEKYKLNGIVEERGWIDYLKNVDKLDDVDVYVQIRRNNILSIAGWPNKLGDYMSNGKPILLFPYGDLVSFISDNPDGFITVNYEIESISLKIKEIISGKYDLLKMGIINRGIAEKNSWESKALEIIKFRNNLIYEK